MPDLDYLPAVEILLNERGKKVLRKNMFYSDLVPQWRQKGTICMWKESQLVVFCFLNPNSHKIGEEIYLHASTNKGGVRRTLTSIIWLQNLMENQHNSCCFSLSVWLYVHTHMITSQSKSPVHYFSSSISFKYHLTNSSQWTTTVCSC